VEIGCQARGFCCERTVEQDDIGTGIGIKMMNGLTIGMRR